jgi:hypothetical protein
VLQATNASLTSQLADVQAASAREKQLLQDKLASAEQTWQGRNKELLEQLLQKERHVAQLTLSEQAALRQAETASSAQVTCQQVTVNLPLVLVSCARGCGLQGPARFGGMLHVDTLVQKTGNAYQSKSQRLETVVFAPAAGKPGCATCGIYCVDVVSAGSKLQPHQL